MPVKYVNSTKVTTEQKSFTLVLCLKIATDNHVILFIQLYPNKNYLNIIHRCCLKCNCTSVYTVYVTFSFFTDKDYVFIL